LRLSVTTAWGVAGDGRGEDVAVLVVVGHRRLEPVDGLLG